MKTKYSINNGNGGNNQPSNNGISMAK